MELTCKYCKEFDSSEKVCRNGIQFRKCYKIKKLVTYKKKICPLFILASEFFCEATGKILTPKKCVDNKTNKTYLNSCKTCSQYTDIIEAIKYNKNQSPTKKKTKLRRRK